MKKVNSYEIGSFRYFSNIGDLLVFFVFFSFLFFNYLRDLNGQIEQILGQIMLIS